MDRMTIGERADLYASGYRDGLDARDIRDQFAAAALAGLLGAGESGDDVPARAYTIADLMLAERGCRTKETASE